MGRLTSTAAGVSLRARLTLIAAMAVAIAVAGIAVAAYVTVSKQLRDQEDSALVSQAQAFERGDVRQLFPMGYGTSRLPNPYTYEFISTSGQPISLALPNGLPFLTPTGQQVTQADRFTSVAQGTLPSTTTYGYLQSGTHVRLAAVHLTTQDGTNLAVLISRNVSDDDATLDHLRLLLFIAGGIGVLFAAAGGLIVARSGLRPVDRLTAAAEHIARTEELDVPIEVVGSDELARLARAFNSMTSALSSSRERQQQLVADAGHELRTPLTSMRTNLDLLIRSERSGRALPPEDRERLMEDLALQMAELGTLVGELVNLARDDRAIEPTVFMDFSEIVGRAVERARLRSEGIIDSKLSPWTISGRPAELERAVVNLLDNAVKFSPAGELVAVELTDGVLTVTDRGPGLSDEDRPHVFERFYRATSSRGMPGSGLGLAIVAQTVAAHGGTVELLPGTGGGTVARLVLPRLDPAEHLPVDDLSDQPEFASAWSRPQN